MSLEPAGDYREEIIRQRAVWARKPALRRAYWRRYAMVAQRLSPHAPTIEIGAGSGNFKEFRPATVATDVVATGPWIERELDAQRLDLPPNSVGNFVAFDVLHHLPRPLDFLAAAARALVSGGRIVLCEPAVTPWSRLVYGCFHHEPLDLAWTPDDAAGAPADGSFANMAIPHLLLRRGAAEVTRRVPGLRLVSLTHRDFLVYPLTGGFSHPSLVPAWLVGPLLAGEDLALRPFASWLTGMRLLAVLERTN